MSITNIESNNLSSTWESQVDISCYRAYYIPGLYTEDRLNNIRSMYMLIDLRLIRQAQSREREMRPMQRLPCGLECLLPSLLISQ